MRHLPNLLTLVNLFCGCCALVCVFSGQFIPAVVFLGVSLLADFLDGFVARLLGVGSEMGKELDSLADMVSFGVVPGAILYTLITLSMEGSVFFTQVHYFALPAFLISAASGYRLAKFNLDSRQTENFIGLATPANTVFFVGLLLIYQFDSFGWRNAVLTPRFLLVLIPISSWLMTSEIGMFSFKIKRLSLKGNEIKFIFAAAAVLTVVFMGWAAPAVIVVEYVILNLVGVFLFKVRA